MTEQCKKFGEAFTLAFRARDHVKIGELLVEMVSAAGDDDAELGRLMLGGVDSVEKLPLAKVRIAAAELGAALVSGDMARAGAATRRLVASGDVADVGVLLMATMSGERVLIQAHAAKFDAENMPAKIAERTLH
jgi:hypothetical protein